METALAFAIAANEFTSIGAANVMDEIPKVVKIVIIFLYEHIGNSFKS